MDNVYQGVYVEDFILGVGLSLYDLSPRKANGAYVKDFITGIGMFLYDTEPKIYSGSTMILSTPQKNEEKALTPPREKPLDWIYTK